MKRVTFHFLPTRLHLNHMNRLLKRAESSVVRTVCLHGVPGFRLALAGETGPAGLRGAFTRLYKKCAKLHKFVWIFAPLRNLASPGKTQPYRPGPGWSIDNF